MLNFKLSKTTAKTILLATMFASFTAFTQPSIAQEQDPAQMGYDIAKRSDESDRGFHDHRVKMKMILRNASGQENIRDMRFSISPLSFLIHLPTYQAQHYFHMQKF